MSSVIAQNLQTIVHRVELLFGSSHSAHDATIPYSTGCFKSIVRRIV